MRKKTYLVSSILLLVLSAVPATLGAATLYVGTEPGDYPTIQSAVAAAGTGDTVLIRTGLYVELIIVDNYVVPGESGSGSHDRTGLTIREAPAGFVSVTSPDEWGDIFYVTANGVTIEGLDIYGATSGGSTSVIGIDLDGADDCVIRDNRCGWDPDFKTLFGIYVRGDANHNIIENNICSYNDNLGIYLHGSDYNQIVNNTCNYSRDIFGSEEGIRLYASFFNAVSGNTCIGNPRGISLDQNNYFNALTNNTCIGNNRGIYLNLNHKTWISGNNIADGNYGIFLEASTDSHLAMNTITGSAFYGIYFATSCWYTRCYLNDLSDCTSGTIFIDSGTDNTFQSLIGLSWFFEGSASKGFTGNRYDDYTGVDADGDGIGDTPYNGNNFTDDFPLVDAPGNYSFETWFLGDQEMHGNQFAQAGTRREIPPGSSAVWVADSPAAGDVTFAAGTAGDMTGWTYYLTVEEAWQDPAGNLSLALGHAEGDGSDFTTVGGQPGTGLSGIANFYYGAFDNAQEFTVPAGRHLALRIESAHPTDSFHILVGSVWSYVSSSHPGPGYMAGPGLTVSCDLACAPATGTVPFTTAMSVELINAEPDRPASRVYARIDVQLAGGAFFPSWKVGTTNIDKGESYSTAWMQNIPALGSMIGDNVFTLTGADITPSPYNQPPYMPSGDTDLSVCTVTAVAP